MAAELSGRIWSMRSADALAVSEAVGGFDGTLVGIEEDDVAHGGLYGLRWRY